MSVGSLQGCNEADYGADALAEHELSRLGGASYMHAHNLFIYLESGLDRRTIFHELGHHVQNKAGVNSDVASQSLLEFHNILMHENKADPFTARFRNHYVDKGRAALGDVAQSINALANLPGPWPKQADDGLRGMIVGELRRLAAIPATPDEDYSSFIVNFVANLIADIARERKAAAPAAP